MNLHRVVGQGRWAAPPVVPLATNNVSDFGKIADDFPLLGLPHHSFSSASPS
jgi:hypothetical protein